VTDDFRVLVKTNLRGVEFQWLDGLATQNGTTVGSLVAEVVRQAYVARGERVEPVQRSKHQRLTDHDRELIRDLHARRWSDLRISAVFDCSPQTISNQRERMGLAPHYKGRRKKGVAA